MWIRRTKPAQPRAATIWVTMDEVEHPVPVPPGADRWDTVARAISRLLRCKAKAEEPPTYDTGTRSWTLNLILTGYSFWGTSVVPVAVRW